MCFIFHNINGIKDEHNWAQINITMKDLDITSVGFAEINNMHSKAVKTKAFWKIILLLKRNCDLSSLTMAETNIKLREAQTTLEEIKRRADELRKNHLLELSSITRE
jgi:hypothetical protein